MSQSYQNQQIRSVLQLWFVDACSAALNWWEAWHPRVSVSLKRRFIFVSAWCSQTFPIRDFFNILSWLRFSQTLLRYKFKIPICFRVGYWFFILKRNFFLSLGFRLRWTSLPSSSLLSPEAFISWFTSSASMQESHFQLSILQVSKALSSVPCAALGSQFLESWH